MNPDYLRLAQAGVYPWSNLKEVPKVCLNAYFKPLRTRSFAIDDALKEDVLWKTQDLLAPPPATGFQLVFLRNNLLTYYKDELKVPAFAHIAESIPKGGHLVTGSHERIPAGFDGHFIQRHRCGILQKTA
jgi:chemotaxis methyl-accepting protein methylase